MASDKRRAGSSNLDEIVSQARRDQAQREKGYRERALKLYPHICGHCGREFEGKRLKELTVHHRDHNHDNNPPDGSNWELLCIYCHENEHARDLVADHYAQDGPSERSQSGGLGDSPFAALGDMLKKK